MILHEILTMSTPNFYTVVFQKRVLSMIRFWCLSFLQFFFLLGFLVLLWRFYDVSVFLSTRWQGVTKKNTNLASTYRGSLLLPGTCNNRLGSNPILSVFCFKWLEVQTSLKWSIDIIDINWWCFSGLSTHTKTVSNYTNVTNAKPGPKTQSPRFFSLPFCCFLQLHWGTAFRKDRVGLATAGRSESGKSLGQVATNYRFLGLQGESFNPLLWILTSSLFCAPWPRPCAWHRAGPSISGESGRPVLQKNVTVNLRHGQMSCLQLDWWKQDEAHEPECRHVCWQTETILICHISNKLTCETSWVHTLRWHPCLTLLSKSCLTLLWDTCKTLLTWHSCKTLLLDIFVGRSSLTLLFHTLVRHSYLTLLWDRLTSHSYLTLL